MHQNNILLNFELEKTLHKTCKVSGIGIHSGTSVTAFIEPAPVGHGIVFSRKDLPGSPLIPALWHHVTSTNYRTTLSASHDTSCKASVETCEHLMAALWALGITNARIGLTGAEMPILDGSAQVWIDTLKQSGIQTQHHLRPCLKVKRSLKVGNERRFLKVKPSETLKITMQCVIEGHIQKFTYNASDCFETHVAKARTFSLKRHVEAMRAKGLIRGGSLANALIIDQGTPVNPAGFRLSHECARHKILDFIGDWALSGYYFVGAIEGYNSGHTLNYQLLKMLMQDPSAFEVLYPEPSLVTLLSQQKISKSF